MVGSKDLPPSHTPFSTVFFHNQFRAKPQWPAAGSNVGLGFEASMQLLGLGLSRLVLAVRSPARGNAAAAKMRRVPLRKANEIQLSTTKALSYSSKRQKLNLD
ncbi:hypothetical protein K438DRAFT_1775464 [Mycena galopus ATCC 62051]|nr:hypothetical protein K438DRAFT_1775464 [Mycena galopus ATCC 62051]